MTPERYEQVGMIFHAALELDSIELADFLDRACAGDVELRREVESLLAYDKGTKETLTMPNEQDGAAARNDPDRGKENGIKFCPQCQRQYPRATRICPYDNQTLSLADPYHLVGLTLAEKYRIEALVSIGGMGAVYSARHMGIDRQVAFKILQPNVALGNERMTGLFEQEAKIVGRLHHDNIADVSDAGHTAEGLAFMVMEWIEGRTLDEEIAASGRLSLEKTTNIIGQIALALDAAHAQNIVHRDLKPSNIMLVEKPDGRNHVKVLDFGIAKIISTTAGSPVSAPIGTPHYASPEQLLEGDRIDRRSDIYSLGIILYQMLTGALPFDDPSVRRIIQMHWTATPPHVREIRSDVPVSVDQLVSQMLAKDPAQRPQRAGDVAAILANAIQKTEKTTPNISKRETNSALERQPPRQMLQARGGRWKYAALIVALVAVASMCIYLIRKIAIESPLPPAASSEVIGDPILLRAPVARLTEDLGHGVILELVKLPGGEYYMGSEEKDAEAEGDEKPKHKVKIDAFAIGAYEITQAQWKAVMGSGDNRSQFRGDDRLPVDNVSWALAQDFIKNLQQRTHQPDYRLPTENEWEYAARAGSTGKWSFGDGKGELSEYAWFAGNASDRTHPVGEKRPNNWGLFDMQGNVMELCDDWYDKDAYKPERQNPREFHVVRGGCIICGASYCRVSLREHDQPNSSKHIGFRVARTIK